VSLLDSGLPALHFRRGNKRRNNSEVPFECIVRTLYRKFGRVKSLIRSNVGELDGMCVCVWGGGETNYRISIFFGRVFLSKRRDFWSWMDRSFNERLNSCLAGRTENAVFTATNDVATVPRWTVYRFIRLRWTTRTRRTVGTNFKRREIRCKTITRYIFGYRRKITNINDGAYLNCPVIRLVRQPLGLNWSFTAVSNIKTSADSRFRNTIPCVLSYARKRDIEQKKRAIINDYREGGGGGGSYCRVTISVIRRVGRNVSNNFMS